MRIFRLKIFKIIIFYHHICLIYIYVLFHADASAQRGSSLRRRHSSGGSVVNPRSGSHQRTSKYTIVHDVLFVVRYIKLNSFTCVYLIINLYTFIFSL